MSFYIMVPTYNEADNIKPLIDDLTSLDIPDLHVLIVDDFSSD